MTFVPLTILLLLLQTQSTVSSESSPDRAALQQLLQQVQHRDDATTAESADPWDSAEPNTSHAPADVTKLTDVAVPVANELWKLTDAQCLNLLTRAGIQTHVPDFETPFVKTPLLLDSPVEGVVIDSKWPRETFRRVMDCRLVAALIPLARYAAKQGVVKIEYYSTWRPITPLKKCGKGVKGNKCQRVYERAADGHLPSQHSRAAAADIRWFTFADGTVADVLLHYETHLHEPPCDDSPETPEGQFLQQLACTLHNEKVFNVMLTPNANKDHENHFHFDITPNVNWYILR